MTREGAMTRAEARLGSLPGLTPSALTRLRASTVALIGTGVLGGGLFPHLALLGSRLIMIDPDRVDAVNLSNQMFPAGSVGAPKAIVRARQAHALNPDCAVESVVARIEALGLAALEEADLLVTAVDGRAARAWTNTVARLIQRPWLDTAVDGSGQRLFGTVALYDPRRDDAACYLCRYDTEQVAAIAHERRGPGCPNWRALPAGPTTPTLQTSAFGAVVGGYAALWAVQALLGQADGLASRQLVVEADVPRCRMVSLTRNPGCPHPGVTLTRTGAVSVGALVAAAAADLAATPDAVTFPGRVLVTGLVCPACLASRKLVRVAEAVTDDELRCACGAEMRPAALTERLAGDDLARAHGLRWITLGIPPDDVAIVHAGARSHHYVVHGRST